MNEPYPADTTSGIKWSDVENRVIEEERESIMSAVYKRTRGRFDIHLLDQKAEVQRIDLRGQG